MNKELLKKLSDQLGTPNVYKDFESCISLQDANPIRLSVTGNINTGKSTLINALLGTQLEVSFVPTGKTHKIVAKGYPCDSNAIESESEWLSSKRIEVWELPFKEMENNLQDLGQHYVQTDLCIMLTAVQSVLTRDEMMHLDFLEQFGIPTIIVLTKADLLEEADFCEVCSYVKNMLVRNKYKNIKVLEKGKRVSVDQLANEVKESVNNILQQYDVRKNSRQALRRLFESHALSKLFESCTKKMQDIENKKNKIEERTVEKENNLSDSAMDWIQLQGKLNQRREDTSNKVSESLEKKRTDIIRLLTHNVEMSQDVKLFWEKELPYKLEDIMRQNSQTAMQLINADVVNTISWLNGEIRKVFHMGLSTLQPISCTIESNPTPTSLNPELADNKKMRIVARVGTAVTVIAAATMLAPLGVGGIVMAASMMAGIGAEFFMNKKQSDAKQRVIELIPNVVDQSQQKLLVDISDNLDRVYTELIQNLQSYQQQWREEAENDIKKERSIALFNCQKELDKWNICMEEINSLSEEILNNK